MKINNDYLPMAWDEPGGRDNNPWKRKNNSGPPDLEKILGDFFKKLFSLGSKNNGGDDGNDGQNNKTFAIVIAVVVASYLLLGIYKVNPGEKAVVTRLGKYHKTVDEGANWLLPFIDESNIVSITKVQTSNHSGLMLTKDENIVFVDIAVNYNIIEPRDFVFNTSGPIRILEQAAESALRQVVGHSILDEVLTEGRARIADAIKKQMVDTIASYKTGLLVTEVSMRPARAPEQVRDAFDDAIKAREDKQTTINDAESDANKVVPVARGRAERMRKEAMAYKEQIQLKAEGEIQRFHQILPYYLKSPAAMQKRMYLETMQDVLGNNKKIILDVGNNNVMYLPLDKAMQ